jgi:hypothetical protein
MEYVSSPHLFLLRVGLRALRPTKCLRPIALLFAEPSRHCFEQLGMTRITFRKGINEENGYPTLMLLKNGRATRHCASGGGYDKYGTVIGDYLAAAYQGQLVALAKAVLAAGVGEAHENTVGQWVFDRPLYGMKLSRLKDKVSLDGACGVLSMISIAQHIGISVETTGSAKYGSEEKREYVIKEREMPHGSMTPAQ